MIETVGAALAPCIRRAPRDDMIVFAQKVAEILVGDMPDRVIRHIARKGVCSIKAAKDEEFLTFRIPDLQCTTVLCLRRI